MRRKEENLNSLFGAVKFETKIRILSFEFLVFCMKLISLELCIVKNTLKLWVSLKFLGFLRSA